MKNISKLLYITLIILPLILIIGDINLKLNNFFNIFPALLSVLLLLIGKNRSLITKNKTILIITLLLVCVGAYEILFDKYQFVSGKYLTVVIFSNLIYLLVLMYILSSLIVNKHKK